MKRRRGGQADTHGLFTLALGLRAPWKVVEVEFSREAKELKLWVDFDRGESFPCPRCQAEGAKGYDTAEKRWRHLNFFEHRCYLHAWVPRVKCQECGAIGQVEVPWARSDSGFTLLFEAMVLALVREMPMRALAELVGEHDTRLWRVLHHHVQQALSEQDLSALKRVGIDETASRRWHRYVSLFFDLDAARMVFGTSGKDKATVVGFRQHLEEHGGVAEAIEEVACDMSPAFLKAVEEQLPEAEVVIDRFHLMKLLNDAVDAVRRQESKENPLLKRTRYLWLKNPSNLNVQQRSRLESLRTHRLKTGRAYAMRLTFQEFFAQPDRESGEQFLKRWYFWATHSRLEPMIKAAKTIKAHWARVLNWFRYRTTNAMLEARISVLQAVKARARGYRSDRNLITMAYLLGGQLKFHLPTHAW